MTLSASRSGRRVALVLEYVFLRARVQWFYPRRPLPSLLTVLDRRRPALVPGDELVHAVIAGERLAAKLHLRDTCLFRALARFALLRAWHGGAVAFHLGLQPTGVAPGHAWVTVDGCPFLDREFSKVTRTYSYPAAVVSSRPQP